MNVFINDAPYFVGQVTSYSNALTLRHVGYEQGVCVPWVAGCICFGAGAGQPHPFTGSEAPPGGRALRVRFRDVVSAKPLYDIEWVVRMMDINSVV